MMSRSKDSILCVPRFLVLLLLCTAILGFFSFSAKADVSCSNCGGTGRITCYTCAGTGQKTCSGCSGTGMGAMKQTMVSPGGYNPITGMFTPPQYQYVQERCILCGGTGRQFCTSCTGGRIMCPSCSGTGRRSGGSSPAEEPETETDPSQEPETEQKPEAYKVKNGTVLAATDGIGDYEDAPNLLDGKKDTKYNVKSTSLYIIWKAPKLLRVSSYVITTGNDNATWTGRNPKSWTLYGSNKKIARNSKSWKKIHSVKNDKKLKDKNYARYTYKLGSVSKPYQYYKLEVTANKGSDCTQMTEFALKGKAVTSRATTLSLAKRTGTTLKVKWKKQSGVTGYQVNYSTSSKFKNGKTLKVKGGSKGSAAISLKKSKKVYIRIRTYTSVNGATVYSSWSKALCSN